MVGEAVGASVGASVGTAVGAVVGVDGVVGVLEALVELCAGAAHIVSDFCRGWDAGSKASLIAVRKHHIRPKGCYASKTKSR